MSVTFRADRRLADAIGQAIVERSKEGGIREGDILITLMAVARGLIDSHAVPNDAKVVITHNCVRALTEPGVKGPRFVSGHTIPEVKQ